MKISELTPPDGYDKDLYELVHFECFPTKIKMTKEQTIGLLGTISKVIAMDEEKREMFFEDLGKIIDEKLGGVVERRMGNIWIVYKAK
uniref:Uncharacterized protein n=1 Tax=Acrobeloides nanus TaxID=290746 RepID=A0A914DCR9_9BILA